MKQITRFHKQSYKYRDLFGEHKAFSCIEFQALSIGVGYYAPHPLEYVAVFATICTKYKYVSPHHSSGHARRKYMIPLNAYTLKPRRI